MGINWRITESYQSTYNKILNQYPKSGHGWGHSRVILGVILRVICRCHSGVICRGHLPAGVKTGSANIVIPYQSPDIDKPEASPSPSQIQKGQGEFGLRAVTKISVTQSFHFGSRKLRSLVTKLSFGEKEAIVFKPNLVYSSPGLWSWTCWTCA